MKFFLSLLTIFYLTSCGNIHHIAKNNLPYVELEVEKERYASLLKYSFNKNYSNFDKNMSKFKVIAKINFEKYSTLRNGTNNLSILKGTVNYMIVDLKNAKTLKKDNIVSTINIGNVSSLYGISKNEIFSRERLTRYLASKLHKKIILSLKQIDN